jgi:hypothetical protein
MIQCGPNNCNCFTESLFTINVMIYGTWADIDILSSRFTDFGVI